VKPLLHYQFGEYRSEIQFTSSIAGCRFSTESGIVLVFDRNTAKISAVDGFPPADGDSSMARVVLPPGERSKSWSAAMRILEKALKEGLGRDGLIVGIGGGMICDLSAFAASLFMRGCRLSLIPTTVLAMVDAAIGGKTAVNYGGYKNMAGTFYPAGQICIAVSLLKTLSRQRERIFSRDPDLMEETVRRCIDVKAGIVAGDLRESGKRAFLNLGHTFAHALEALTGYRLWSHGHAVAWGLVQAAVLAERLGLADPSYTKTVRDLVRSYGFDLHVKLKPESIVGAMQADKKKRQGKLRLVLQRGIGDTVVREVDPLLIAETLKHSSRNFS
jgi:3-dehydroquinate synthase